MTKQEKIEEAPAPEVVVEKPFIGQVVWYWPKDYEVRHFGAVEGPWAAIISRILEEGPVTIHVFAPTPVLVGQDPICRMEGVPFSEVKAPGSWGWAEK